MKNWKIWENWKQNVTRRQNKICVRVTLFSQTRAQETKHWKTWESKLGFVHNPHVFQKYFSMGPDSPIAPPPGYFGPMKLREKKKWKGGEQIFRKLSLRIFLIDKLTYREGEHILVISYIYILSVVAMMVVVVVPSPLQWLRVWISSCNPESFFVLFGRTQLVGLSLSLSASFCWLRFSPSPFLVLFPIIHHVSGIFPFHLKPFDPCFDSDFCMKEKEETN